jgi:LEA14-like dessication related protein
MKTKYVIVVVVFVLLLTAGWVAYDQYVQLKAIQNLKVELLDVKIYEVTLSSLRINFIVQVHNPNPREVTVGKFGASFFANGVHLADFNSTAPFKMVPLDSVQQQISVRLRYLDVGLVLLGAIRDKQVEWAAKGSYELQLPLGIVYPYRFEVRKTFSP